MSALAENLAILEQRYPELKRVLETDHRGEDRFEIISAKPGMPTAKVNGVFLHSSYDPLREAERAIASYVDPMITTYIIYGFGLGYYIEVLQQQIRDEVDLYVMIDNGNYFLSALSARPLKKIFNRTRTHYLLETRGAAVVRLAQHIDNEALRIVNIRSIVSTNPAYFSAIDAELSELSLRKRGNANTIARFGLSWADNCLRNLPAILSAVDCADTQGIMSHVPPVLIVSAGPSLERVLHRLSGWARKTIVIAVDTACTRLQRAGVIPDVIVTIDPQYWNSRHIERIESSQSFLLFDPCVHPRALRKTYRQRIVFSTAVPIVQLISKHLPLRSSIGAGGTVTSVGWEFARWIGAPAVYLIGADFGYPHRAIHCRECFFEERMAATGNMLCSYETLYHRYFCASPLEKTRSYRDQPLVSDHKLAIYANWFEKHIARYDTPKTIALNGEGRRIATARYQSHENTIEELPDQTEHKQRYLQAMAELPALEQKTTQDSIMTLRNNMRNVIGAITNIARGMEKGEAAGALIAASDLLPIEKEIARTICSHSVAFSGSASPRDGSTIGRVVQKISTHYLQ